ncbi:DUF4097 and DUF4098 domain-containing protein YvlB [Actinokineospora baliensis]|uniref:DUF4097 family beta strand repeat-containing protein n=1 Tax=Actinokineospora baliensis TaxID=547056 RepID=UPI00195A1FEA|nr:DUF4097 family beta strand repeat-containing protein [Actinokineospora baliensis]MBM7774223.1 DUF4097 and DUF4098 domain-containing protein YvlB [Actinokineospora baliensis]
MPTFATPEPISVTLELGVVGEVRVAATDRTDTVVEVRPSDAADESDVKAASQVRVEYANGTLLVKGPKSRAFDFSRKSRSVEVTIDLPTGSRVSGDVQVGGLRGEGLLGETRFKSATGNIRLERTGPLRLDTAAGHITVGRAAGNAEIHTGSGKVAVGEVDGAAVVKNSNGTTEIDVVTGDLRVRAANGDISVERAGSGVDAKSANGGVRVGQVVRGTVVLATSIGDIEVGIAEGTAAWLEADTGFGQVRNELTSADRKPADSGETVEVRARTSHGDITIRRS